jgi:hypothetical protein
MMLPRIVGLAVAVVVTWMVFFGAGYFGGVWRHYFADEPPKNTGDVSAIIIKGPAPNAGQCAKGHPCPEPPRPHD